ncbi:MAG: glycosyltransferase family 4 protein [Longimicrobiaceae bacterium]
MTRPRALFVNAGFLGHASVARLVRQAVGGRPEIEASHLDLSAALTPGERVVRRVMCAGPRGAGAFPGAALLLPRFRHELHAGVLAARRIRALEAAGGRFDAIHFHTQATAWGSLRRMRRTPCIVSIDATQRLASAEAGSAVERLDYAAPAAMDRRVFAAAAAIVSTSRWAADDLLRGQPECAGRLHVLPYPVALEGFGAEWPAERAARAGADPRAPVRVLFVGGDFPRKGGFELLRAWREGGLHPHASLTLVTDWPLDAAALPPGVSLRRGVRACSDDWLAAWRSADLFAMPTRGEAFGMVFQEAAAAGLPAVGTRLNAIPEIVAHGETGLLVPPGDAGALAEALRALVASPATRRRMGTAARARIERTGSVAAYGARLAALVREVAGDG